MVCPVWLLERKESAGPAISDKRQEVFTPLLVCRKTGDENFL
jgi:hypothetical protein